MTQSMTAFARSESSSDWGVLTLELRAVNHRYLDVSMRLPEDIRVLETKLRNTIAARVSRGKLELNIRIQSSNDQPRELTINVLLVEQLAKANRQIEQLLYNPSTINPMDVLHWPGVIQSPQLDIKAFHAAVLALLDQALDDFVQNRQREGEKLAGLIRERCQSMQGIVAEVEQKIPDIINSRREKITARLEELAAELDQNRLEQEVVYMIQKLDVAEELDRLKAHFQEVQHVLEQAKPVGRRLDFLMQELNREANTLGSKSVDTSTTRASVDMKVLIEQMREQVQNIE